jgi:hypothetical protein
LDFVSFFRLSTVICASAAAAFALSSAAGAQGFKKISLAVEPDSGAGYMQLGGGLEKALIDEQPPVTSEVSEAEPEKPAVEKPEAKKKAEKPAAKKEVETATVSHARERPRTVARSAPRRSAANITPTALVARTLDHTGMNIGLLRVQTPAP